MSQTYDPTLSTDKDWVRFLVGDRVVDGTAVLEDEEIEALLVEEPNKYMAAARACEVILADRGDVVSKSVDDLSISYSGSAESAYREHVRKLKQRGATEAMKTAGKSAVMRVL